MANIEALLQKKYEIVFVSEILVEDNKRIFPQQIVAEVGTNVFF